MPQLFPTFPELTIYTDASTVQDNDYKPSYSFDFASGDFLLDGAGRMRLSDGEAAWKQWCIKALCTQRGAYAAYDEGYGVAVEEAMREPTRGAQKSHLERTITEALMAHPRTSAVRDFEYADGIDGIQTTFTVIGKNDSQIRLAANFTA